MRIAYYGYGNLDEEHDKFGLGTIYDNNGNILLRENEKLITKEDKVRTEVISRRRYDIPMRFDDAGVGTLYRTNQRMIYIRNPSARWQAVIGAVHSTLERWIPNLHKECWDLPLNEIVGIIKRKIKGEVIVLAISGKDLFTIHFQRYVLWGDNYKPSIWEDLYDPNFAKGYEDALYKCKK